MDSEAQKLDAMKKSAKYRRHVMKKKKHERNIAQAREYEERPKQYRKQPNFDTHKAYAHKTKHKKVTAGRLSVPRGLFLKGKASCVMKKTGGTYLNALNYARKKEELGQIIKIGMDQTQKLNSQVNFKRKSNKDDPMKRLPEETGAICDETDIMPEEKRRKTVNHIKAILGLDDPGPSSIRSPSCDARDTQLAAGGSQTQVQPSLKLRVHQRNVCSRRSPDDLDSLADVLRPSKDLSQNDFNKEMCSVDAFPDVEERKEDEMDDLFLEKLVSDIGLYAWNSQKSGSEPYENCDKSLIKEIMSLRNKALNETNRVKQTRKTSETITALPPGLPQSTPKPVMIKDQSCENVAPAPNYLDLYKKTGVAITKEKVQQKILTSQHHFNEHDMHSDGYRELRARKEAETCCHRIAGTGDEPSGMVPLPELVSFVSPSTPPIAQHAFNPKAFMQDVEGHQGPEQMLSHLPRGACATGSADNGSRFDHSEEESNRDDYDTALSQRNDTEASGKSDDSDVCSNLYKYRRAMY